MPDVKRTVKILTTQKIIPNADSGVQGFPLRHWTLSVVLLNSDKQEQDADLFASVTYVLHESFGDKARQAFKKPPFRVAEDGWGEFELQIVLKDVSGKDHTILHDLNFQQESYETKHVFTFKNPKEPLLTFLRKSGPIPGESSGGGATTNGTSGDASSKKRGTTTGADATPGGGGETRKKKKADGKSIDMDKLAEGLQKLGEDDLLQVVQMVHDNKSEESWMRNDIEQGEFHVDLYTLPEGLIKMLWEFTAEKGAIAQAPVAAA